jgi:hypothetical protein
VFGVVLDVPMAAILGLQQRFFLNSESPMEGQCISWKLISANGY